MKRPLSQFHGAAGLILLQLICLAFAGDESNSSVYITELKVPTSVENGTEKSIILDCNFKLANNDTAGLVITWTLNSTQRVYQWIPGKDPQGIGILEDKLDLSYSPSQVSFEKHRALKILRPTTELSGDYKCGVSSIAGYASKEARMIVYVAAKEMNLTIVPSSTPNSINVTCSAFGVFPEPKLILFYGPNRTTRNRLDDVETSSSLSANGAFDICVHKVIHQSNLTNVTHFNCDLLIPNTSYVENEMFIHGRPDYGDGAGSSLGQPHWWNGLLFLIISGILLT